MPAGYRIGGTCCQIWKILKALTCSWNLALLSGAIAVGFRDLYRSLQTFSLCKGFSVWHVVVQCLCRNVACFHVPNRSPSAAQADPCKAVTVDQGRAANRSLAQQESIEREVPAGRLVYLRLIQWSIEKKRGENDVAGQLIRPFEFVSLHHQKLHFICPWLEASSSRLPVGTIPVFSKRRPRCIASRKPNKSQSLLQHVAPSIASAARSRTQVSE